MFDRCIYFNLTTLTRQISKAWQNEFAAIGLSASHAYLLAAIAESPDVSQKDLAAILELDASTVTRFIDSLVAKKIIERSKVGKGARYELTDRGKKMAGKVDTIMDSLFADMQRAFGKRSFKQFVNQLKQAKHRLEEQE